MKILKFSASLFLAIFLAGAFVSDLQAQDNSENYRQAVQIFNQARETAQQNDFEQAINLFNRAISLAEQVDSEQANDLISRAQKLIPGLQYQQAVSIYKEFQQAKSLEKLNETITAFEHAANLAGDYGQDETQQKASRNATRLLYSRATIHYRNNNLDKALESADEAISRRQNYAKAYHLKGKVYTKEAKQDLDMAMQLFDRAIEVGNQTGDNQTVRKANQDARDELIYRGVKAMNENKEYDRAEDLLNRALKYDSESPNAYYRLAELSNKRANWSQTLNYANKALQYETGGRTDKAKIYFEQAVAYKGMGQKEQACEAFSNAAYGSFKSRAEHEMEFELKCSSATN